MAGKLCAGVSSTTRNAWASSRLMRNCPLGRISSRAGTPCLRRWRRTSRMLVVIRPSRCFDSQESTGRPTSCACLPRHRNQLDWLVSAMPSRSGNRQVIAHLYSCTDGIKSPRPFKRVSPTNRLAWRSFRAMRFRRLTKTVRSFTARFLISTRRCSNSPARSLPVVWSCSSTF